MPSLNARSQRRLGRDASRPAKLNEQDEANAIFGTWDFKWPRKSIIRVAFQFPRWLSSESGPDRETFISVVSNIQRITSLWTADSSLSFDWLSPGKLTLAAVPEANIATDTSDALVPSLSAKSAEFGKTEYDVLVSLDQLSLAGNPGPTTTAYALPSAELGTYNRRSNYGTPTVYLGPLGIWTADAKDYYAPASGKDDIRRLVRFHILHEFGHVLGLVHTHQDPKWRQANPDAYPRDELVGARLRSILTDRLKLSASFVDKQLPQFADSHVVDPWPGNAKYSDWRSDAAPSAMFVPFMHCLRADGALVPAVCPDCLAEIPQAPSPGDLAQLAAIYG